MKKEFLKLSAGSYIILSVLVFLPLFLLTGLTVVFSLPSTIFFIMLCISSWSSTFAFIILYKRTYPRRSLRRYVIEKFKPRIRLWVVIAVVGLQLLLFIATKTVLMFRGNSDENIFGMLSIVGIIYLFFKNLIAGPLGEELGWRGFLQNELQNKYSPVKSAFIVGVFWGLWHTPIWFTSGFKGGELAVYILFFMVSIISLSIIIAMFYNINNNLLIPIIIHQLFNFFTSIIGESTVEVTVWCGILYLLVAAVSIIINPKEALYSKKKRGSKREKVY